MNADLAAVPSITDRRYCPRKKLAHALEIDFPAAPDGIEIPFTDLQPTPSNFGGNKPPIAVL